MLAMLVRRCLKLIIMIPSSLHSQYSNLIRSLLSFYLLSDIFYDNFTPRNTVEERVTQVAKKKMMLTHLVVQPGIPQFSHYVLELC